MANADFSKLSKELDLQDMSGSSAPSNKGAIYFMSGALNVNAVEFKGLLDPNDDQDAATKAYVDAQITAQDLDFQGDSGGALSIDLDSETLDIAGGTGISTAGSGNTLTVTLDDTAVSANSYGSAAAVPSFTVDAQGRLTAAGSSAYQDASDSTKGVASFASAEFDVSSGAVSIKDGGIATAFLAADAVTAAKLADDAVVTANIVDLNVTTAKLAGDAVTSAKIADDAVNSEHIALGALDMEHYGTGSIQSIHLAGAIANAKLANSSVTVTAGDGLTGGGAVSLGGSVSVALQVDDSSLEINSDTARIKASGVTNAMLAGSIANTKLVNDSVIVGSTEIDLGASSTSLGGLTGLDFTAASAAIAASLGANTLTIAGATSTVAIPGGVAALQGMHIGAADGYDSDGASFTATGGLSMKGALSVGANNSGGGQAGNQDFIVFGQSQSKNVFFDASEDTLTVNAAFAVNGDSTIVGDIAMNGDMTLQSDHDVKARSFITYSDRELKTNIQPMNDALNKVMKLEAVSYDLKAGKKNEIGFIAQDVAKVVPEVCALDANGEGRGIDYSRMSALLAGALKAQQEQIAQLKEIVAKLQK